MKNNYKFLFSIFTILLLIVACANSKKTESNSIFSQTENKGNSGSAVFTYDGTKYSYAYKVQENTDKGVMYSKDITMEQFIELVGLVINNIEGYEAIVTKTPLNQLIEPYKKSLFKIKGKKNDFYFLPQYNGDKVAGFVYNTRP
ncbi:MAG: hypothetical protein JSS63_07390 [Bacteroidetes bacterium]|nr:hypothetical protein [Bacteroidota bacterium]